MAVAQAEQEYRLYAASQEYLDAEKPMSVPDGEDQWRINRRERSPSLKRATHENNPFSPRKKVSWMSPVQEPLMQPDRSPQRGILSLYIQALEQSESSQKAGLEARKRVFSDPSQCSNKKFPESPKLQIDVSEVGSHESDSVEREINSHFDEGELGDRVPTLTANTATSSSSRTLFDEHELDDPVVTQTARTATPSSTEIARSSGSEILQSSDTESESRTTWPEPPEQRLSPQQIQQQLLYELDLLGAVDASVSIFLLLDHSDFFS